MRLITALALCLYAPLTHAQQTVIDAPSPLDEAFDSLVNQILAKWKVPGLSITVVDGDNTYAKGYGIATFPDTPVTPGTLFYTGSTAKAFTAGAISLLIDESSKYKDIQWATPIRTLLGEDFELADNYSTHHVTVEDALCHRTGLMTFDLLYFNTSRTVQEVVQTMRYVPLTAEIRTKFQYSNLMFSTLCYVIETLTGEWLGDFFAKRIWHPLGMGSTYFSLADAQNSPKHLAQGYFYNKVTGNYDPEAYIDAPAMCGCGGIVSNVLDYAKWLRMMLTNGSPLSAAAHEAIVTPHFIAGPPLWRHASTWLYGLGWDLSTYRGERVIWHQGGLPGWGSYVLYLPDRAWAVAAFGNTGETSNEAEGELVWHLIDELLGVPKAQRADAEREGLERRDLASEGSQRAFLI
ncbi:hypothetical protein MMC30_004703 [Trapelia coarctata]|nr:hypothetical protein [Trapelia coarctata]